MPNQRESSSKRRKLDSGGKTTQKEDGADLSLTLDPMEVMRAMMAAQSGKRAGPATSGENSEDEEAGDDDGEDDNPESGQSDEEGGSVGSDSEADTAGREGDDGNAGDSHRDQDDDAIDGEDEESNRSAVPLPSAPSRSRIALASRSAPRPSSSARSTNPPSSVPSDPFASHPKPAAATFEALGLSVPLINALATINITKPTEIQAACVEAIMAGRDCIGGAKTGSGKTLAFALPIVERIARDPYGVWAVVLTPTRELAYQLTEQFLAVGKPLGLKTVTIVGGMDSMTQAAQLEARPHIIVATPGRLCDLLRSDGVKGGKLGRVKCLVLDEADRLLTPTFAPELSYLFSQIPENRQTCLFTATISDTIIQLANKPPSAGKQKPFMYRVESETLTVGKLKQKYLFIPSQIRDPYLVYLLHHPPAEIDAALIAPPAKKEKARRHGKGKGKNQRKRQASPSSDEESSSPAIASTIIFTARCATAHLLHLMLAQLDIPSVPLHSHLTQPQRLLSLARFRARDVPILITTDVGSRGLDIPSVAMVINWDCPRRADDYVHRVGRTARAGRGGMAVTIVTERDTELVQMIEKEIGTELVEMTLPEGEVLEGMNAASLARRMATMEMHDSSFGERQAINKAKAIKRAKRDAAAKA